MGEQLPALIQQMLQPTFYGNEDTKNVSLIQTHISYLLIGNVFTYKVKKGIDLGFLDFTKLEDRKRFCEEEIRLNSKLAPLLYLEVAPIFQTASGAFSLIKENNSEVVEYAVKMNTFDNSNLFSALFENGQLNEDTFKKLAIRLAKHHISSAKTNDAIASYGTPKRIKNILDGNFSVVDKYVENTVKTDLYQKIKKASYSFLDEHKAFFDERVNEGKIKENHGDLHLNNICLYKNEVQIFDCIEFNEQFKNIDCIYDVAFLFMDLIFKKSKAFAYAFLNEYLEQTGDYKAVQLLPLYTSMRAFIRGKVISIETTDEHISKDQQARSRTLASDYFKLALTFLDQPRGKVFIIMGLSGSGKSTLAQKLASKKGAIHLRTDAIRKHLTNTGLLERKDIYTLELTDKTYKTLADHGITASKAGFDVILDGTFLQYNRRAKLSEQLSSENIAFEFIYCHAEESILFERLKQRQNDVSDATPHVLEKQLQTFEPLEKENHIRVDTTSPDHFERLASDLGLIKEY